MEQQQYVTSDACGQSRSTVELEREIQKPRATYSLKLNADSGYEAEQTGRINPSQYGAACAVLADPEFAEVVIKMADERKRSNKY